MIVDIEVNIVFDEIKYTSKMGVEIHVDDENGIRTFIFETPEVADYDHQEGRYPRVLGDKIRCFISNTLEQLRFSPVKDMIQLHGAFTHSFCFRNGYEIYQF